MSYWARPEEEEVECVVVVGFCRERLQAIAARCWSAWGLAPDGTLGFTRLFVAICVAVMSLGRRPLEKQL